MQPRVEPKVFMSNFSLSSATKGPQQPPDTPHRITHRQQRWRSSQSSKESGHLALPLELIISFSSNIVKCGPISLRHINRAITFDVCDSAHLSTALQLHLFARLHLSKAVVRHIQMLQRLVDTKDISKGLGTSSAHSTI